MTDYTIVTGGPLRDVHLNQQALTGWQDQGDILFSPSDFVSLSDWDSADLYHTKYIGADAVQFANCRPGDNPGPVTPPDNGSTTTPVVGRLLQLQQGTDTRTAPSFSSPARWHLDSGRVVLIVDTRSAEGATWWDLDDSRNGGGTGWFTYDPVPQPNSPLTIAPTAIPATPAASPTSTAIPATSTSTVIPATRTSLPPLAVTTADLPTYHDHTMLAGTRDPALVAIYVSSFTSDAMYPDSTHWQIPVSLVVGSNTFNVYGRDSQGNTSATITITISRHKLADINGDGRVDLTDFSMLAHDYGKSTSDPSVHPLSDMNDDGIVGQDDADILKANWTG